MYMIYQEWSPIWSNCFQVIELYFKWFYFKWVITFRLMKQVITFRLMKQVITFRLRKQSFIFLFYVVDLEVIAAGNGANV
mgnify:CR=1 FL=1